MLQGYWAVPMTGDAIICAHQACSHLGTAQRGGLWCIWQRASRVLDAGRVAYTCTHVPAHYLYPRSPLCTLCAHPCTASVQDAPRLLHLVPPMYCTCTAQDFPVERLALSYDRRVLASTSHDSVVKLWDMGLLLEDDDEEDGEGEEGEGEEGVDGAEALLARAMAAGGSGSEDDEENEDFEGEEGESEDGEGEDGNGSEGEREEEAEGEKGAGCAGGAGDGGKQKRGVGGEAAKGKGGKQGLAAGPGSGDGSDGGGGDSDSDSDAEGGRKKKRAKRERTKWTKGTEQKKKPAGNFFADLL